MFNINNIGGKIKSLSSIFFWIELGFSLILGFSIMVTSEDEFLVPYIVMGVLVWIFGALFSWLSLWLLYGFGELIENSNVLVEKNNQSQLEKAEIFYKCGDEYLTEEEYNQRLRKLHH